jgi:hypothetical protein
MYGKDATIDITAQAEKELIIENADLLNISQNKPRGPPSLIPASSQPKEAPKLESPSAPSPVVNNTAVTSSPSKPILKQTETRRPDGKRRITPMFIPLSESPTQSRSEFGTSTTDSPQTEIRNEIKAQTINPVPMAVVNGDSVKLDARLALRDAPQRLEGEISSITPAPTTSTAPKSANILPVIKMTSGKAQALTGSQCVKMVSEYRIQVMNDAHKTNFGNLSRVVCLNVSSNQQQLQGSDRKAWEVTIGSPVSSFSVCSRFVLIGAMDGSVRFIHIKDGRLVVPILNQASPVLLTAFVSVS